MITRRSLLAASVAGAAMLALRLPLAAPAFAQAGGAAAFIQNFGNQLVAVVNGPGELSQKEAALRPLIDSAVDVEGVARFCLGRYARDATPAQLQEFTRLFHAVLVNNVASKVGEYKGVTFQTGGSTRRGDEELVSTVVTRPNNQPNNVQWVVSRSTGSPKIVDVVAEGTSLRLTQRSDYASFLGQHGGKIDALLDAMRRQASNGG